MMCNRIVGNHQTSSIVCVCAISDSLQMAYESGDHVLHCFVLDGSSSQDNSVILKTRVIVYSYSRCFYTSAI